MGRGSRARRCRPSGWKEARARGAPAGQVSEQSAGCACTGTARPCPRSLGGSDALLGLPSTSQSLSLPCSLPAGVGSMPLGSRVDLDESQPAWPHSPRPRPVRSGWRGTRSHAGRLAPEGTCRTDTERALQRCFNSRKLERTCSGLKTKPTDSCCSSLPEGGPNPPPSSTG